MDCHLAEQIIWAFGLWVLYGSTNPWTASRAEHGGVFFSFIKSQGCIKFICPCLHREIFPKINVHFWRIHVGASGSCSLREEYTLGLMLLASLAISGRFAAFGLSQVGFGLILRLYTKYSLPLYTQGDCSFQFYEVPEVYIVNLPQRVLRDLSKDWCTLLVYQKLMYME